MLLLNAHLHGFILRHQIHLLHHHLLVIIIVIVIMIALIITIRSIFFPHRRLHYHEFPSVVS
jgi:hypothetical protein